MYCELLGVLDAKSLHVERWRGYGDPGWLGPSAWDLEHRDYLVLTGLSGKCRLDLRGMRSTRILTADFDPPETCPVRRVRGISETIGECAKLNAEHDARWRAEACKALIERIQEVYPATLIERTKRGFHVVWKLSAPVSVLLAARLAAALVARVAPENGVKIESFPLVEAGGGRTCSLPLLGCHREVEVDLLTLTSRLRRPSIDRFLADEGVDAEALAELLAVDREAQDEAAVSDPVVRLKLAPEPAPPHLEVTEGHLLGSAFAEHCVALLRDGIPAGEHWPAIRKLVACFAYVSRCAEEVRARMEVFLGLSIHGSRHAQRDPKHLLRDVDCQLRHFERGVEAGRCRYDGMKSAWIRRFMAELDETVYRSDGELRAA